MLKFLKLNLQLFGEGGGDGGDGGSAGASAQETVGADSGEKKIPASIPEKAKKYYQKALERNSSAQVNNTSPKADDDTAQTTDVQGTTDKISYADFIKEHKEEHKAYMDKTIGDRLKKYKGIEEELGKHKALLDTVAQKYGVNPDSEDFLQVLGEKIEADDSYYENYAMEHDISTEEARKIVTMERKVARIEAEKEQAQKQEQMRQQIMTLRSNAEKTKSQFPGFDLDLEMQNEKFRRLCAVTGGDTTAAYMTCHWNEILPATVQMASQRIQAQTANAVASNKARPAENGISSNAPSVVQNDFRNMNLQQLRAYADEQRRKSGR